MNIPRFEIEITASFGHGADCPPTTTVATVLDRIESELKELGAEVAIRWGRTTRTHIPTITRVVSLAEDGDSEQVGQYL